MEAQIIFFKLIFDVSTISGAKCAFAVVKERRMEHLHIRWFAMSRGDELALRIIEERRIPMLIR